MALAISFLLASAPAAIADQQARPWPDTTRGVHVFNDQLAPWMSEAQFGFAGRNYAGTQKMLRSDADRLRRHNAGFIVLHYRLGHAIGYRLIEGNCDPTGEMIRVIEGDSWVEEWPANPNPQWFATAAGERILNCDWGWYLANPANESFRKYWHDEVLRQVKANGADGVFMDSLSVPNYLGAGAYDPALAPIDEPFEEMWTRRIDDWLSHLQARPLGAYHVVPNVGSWITSRDRTTYEAADGAMVEGFALEADASPYPLSDWQLQQDRILGLVRDGKAVIEQTYASGKRERMFTIGSHLLTKGNRTYVNIDIGEDPEWWPEYDLPVGRPLHGARGGVGDLAVEEGVYMRRFSRGRVYVNATNPFDETARTTTVSVPRGWKVARTSGGGVVGRSGRRPGKIRYRNRRSMRLGPMSATVIVKKSSARAPSR